MKVAIICSSFFPVVDGVTIAVYKRLEQLSRLGHQTILFCPDYRPLAQIYPDYQDYTGEILPGVEVISLPSSKAIALEFERDLTPKSSQIIQRQLEQFQPDLIHVDEAERLGLCLLKLPGVKYAQQHQIPCVSWFHTNYIDYLDDYLQLPFGLNRIVKQVLGSIFVKIYNSYDVTLVSSSITAQKIKQLGIRNTLQAELLGYDADRFKQVAKTAISFGDRYHLPDLHNKIKLIFIGRLTPDKGWHFTLEALAQLPPEISDRLAIIIAGDGTLKTEVEHKLQQLTSDVYLLGRISPQAIPELLTYGDIFVTNSEKETRGLTVIEAAAAGIPAIAPRAGGVIDTIVDGESGWLYQPQDRADFLSKLTSLITNEDLRKSMGAIAKEAAQQYTWEHCVNNLIEIWQAEIKRQ
ncbi:MAG: glycosyltransferase, partial [Cyanobacteria bacterium J06643_13]